MLAAAGMVVTEMSTPTSAPDLAVERESAPAVPARSATRIVYLVYALLALERLG
jgi:hypothetical protein